MDWILIDKLGQHTKKPIHFLKPTTKDSPITQNSTTSSCLPLGCQKKGASSCLHRQAHVLLNHEVAFPSMWLLSWLNGPITRERAVLPRTLCSGSYMNRQIIFYNLMSQLRLQRNRQIIFYIFNLPLHSYWD